MLKDCYRDPTDSCTYIDNYNRGQMKRVSLHKSIITTGLHVLYDAFLLPTKMATMKNSAEDYESSDVRRKVAGHNRTRGED